MLDFLILYQHPLREMENICLLRVELERRGYSVDFRYIWDPWTLKYNLYKRPKVIITSALYDDRDYINFVCWNGGRNKKVVNLQWEQVTTPSYEEYLQNRPKGIAKKATFISWGRYNHEFLLKKSGIESTVITGPVQMDFLRENFLPYYLTKREICQKFKLPESHKIFLYISSFSLSSQTKDEEERAKADEGRWMNTSSVDTMYKEEKESKQRTVDWFRRLLSENSDMVLVYRPHPAERGDPPLVAMQDEFANFKVIQEYSVKQWILSADKILTTYSTSIADAFFAQKTCGILRPMPLSKNNDILLYENATTINTYEELLNFIGEEAPPFPIPAEDFYKHYDVQDIPSYIRICDFLVDVHSTEKYDMEAPIRWFTPKIFLSLKRGPAFFFLRQNRGYRPGVIRRGLWGLWDRLCHKYEWYLRDYTSKEEIARILERVRNILSVQ